MCTLTERATATTRSPGPLAVTPLPTLGTGLDG